MQYSLGDLRPDVGLHLGGVHDGLVAEHPHQVAQLHLGLVRRHQAQPHLKICFQKNRFKSKYF